MEQTMAKIYKYKGCTFCPTETTTETAHSAFGKTYIAISAVWEVFGRIEKGACAQPFLPSASACREFINDTDDREADRVRRNKMTQEQCDLEDGIDRAAEERDYDDAEAERTAIPDEA
jgi:hypothetical protein